MRHVRGKNVLGVFPLGWDEVSGAPLFPAFCTGEGSTELSSHRLKCKFQG